MEETFKRPMGKEVAVAGARLLYGERQSCDRLHHVMHQHIQPLRDDRRGPCGAQSGSAGFEPQALGQDIPRTWFAGCDGISGSC